MRPGVQPPSGSMACPLVPPSGRLTNQPARPLLGESRRVGRKGRLTAGFTRGRRFTCHSEAQAAAVRRPSLHTWPRLGQGHFRKRGGRSFLDIGAVPTLSAAARHPRPRGPPCHLPVRATTSWLSRAHGGPSRSASALLVLCSPVPPDCSPEPRGLCPPGRPPARPAGPLPCCFPRVGCWSRTPLLAAEPFRQVPPRRPPPEELFLDPQPDVPSWVPRAPRSQCMTLPLLVPPRVLAPAPPRIASGCLGHCGCSGTLVGWMDARAP